MLQAAVPWRHRNSPPSDKAGREMPPGEPHRRLLLFPSFSQARAGRLHVLEESEFRISRSKNLAMDSPRGSVRRAVPLAGRCSRGPARTSPSPAGDKAAGLSPLCQGAPVGARRKGGLCAVSPAKPGTGPRAMTPRWRAALLTDARVGLNPRLASGSRAYGLSLARGGWCLASSVPNAPWEALSPGFSPGTLSARTRRYVAPSRGGVWHRVFESREELVWVLNGLLLGHLQRCPGAA